MQGEVGFLHSSNNSYSKKLTAQLKSPSVEFFIRASTGGNSMKFFAMYLNLTNACQTLDDVSKVKTQVPKIALVTLVNESTCTLQELAGNVQNAGYSVLIYFAASYAMVTVKNSKNKVLIPLSIVPDMNRDQWSEWYSTLDRKYVDIITDTDERKQMESYLKRLYFWFLIGPLITLEWMRRTRKFFWMSDSQDDEREAEERTTERRKTKEMLLKLKFELWKKVKMELRTHVNFCPQITKARLLLSKEAARNNRYLLNIQDNPDAEEG